MSVLKTVLLKEICDFEKGTTGLAKAVPSEYLFVKSQDCIENLKSQTVTSSLEHGGRITNQQSDTEICYKACSNFEV